MEWGAREGRRSIILVDDKFVVGLETLSRFDCGGEGCLLEILPFEGSWLRLVIDSLKVIPFACRREALVSV